MSIYSGAEQQTGRSQRLNMTNKMIKYIWVLHMDKHRHHRLKWRRFAFDQTVLCLCWVCVYVFELLFGTKDAWFIYTLKKKYNGRNNKPIQQISRLSIKAIPSISRQSNNQIEQERRCNKKWIKRVSTTALSAHTFSQRGSQVRAHKTKTANTKK